MKRMKNYAAITSTYLGSAGLLKVQVRCAATGQPITRLVTRKVAEDLSRQGRIIRSDQ